MSKHVPMSQWGIYEVVNGRDESLLRLIIILFREGEALALIDAAEQQAVVVAGRKEREAGEMHHQRRYIALDIYHSASLCTSAYYTYVYVYLRRLRPELLV